MPQKKRPSTPSPKAEEKRARGRPKFKPTPEQRQTVEAMAGFGIPELKMCQLVRHAGDGQPISINTLLKHFRAELDSGHAKADTMVAKGLFKNATTATPTYPGGIPVAQIFWLKTRARWRTADKDPATAQLPEQPLTPEQQDDRETVRRLAFLLERGAAATVRAKKKEREPA